MNGYLIDTSVVAELRRGERANAGVKEWFDKHAEHDLWLSVLVVGELRRGVALIRHRESAAAELLDGWLVGLEASYADRILPVSLDVTRRWATLNVPYPFPAIDGLIAATALTHELVLVTRNVVDLEPSGAELVNPFT